MSESHAAVRETIEAYTSACLDGDPDAYAATLLDDVVFCPPDHPRLRGREAARRWAREIGETLTVSGSFFNIFRQDSAGAWKYAYLIWNSDRLPDQP